MKTTLEEVVNEAYLFGYDFNELLSNLKVENLDIEEYLYGYYISKDKVSYLELMAEGHVSYCDRIFLCTNEIQDYVERLKSEPNTKIFSDFYKIENNERDDGVTCDMCIFRIIGIRDLEREVFVIDLEYNYKEKNSHQLGIWRSEMDYEQVSNIISSSGTNDLIQKSRYFVWMFTKQDAIAIS